MSPGHLGPRGRRLWGRRLGGACALAIAGALALGTDDAAAAATVRNAANALGALALIGTILFLREWPLALTGSVWAAGTLFAIAVWFLRTWPVAWLTPGRLRQGRSADRERPRPEIVLDAAKPSPSPGVGADEVLAAARHCFVRLQAAWDAGDIEELSRYTTAEMLDELLQELPMRSPGVNRTDVVTLEAALLALEPIGSSHVASIEFSGMIRESSDRGAEPFKELWLLTCHTGNVSGWRLARHQALM